MHFDGNVVDGASETRPKDVAIPPSSRPWRIFAVLGGYGVVLVLLQIVLHRSSGMDYVGIDNDDAMRLVEVRDLLAGQSWFDMTQYRLGLEGGTLMHWSRFVDLPIALLIRFFSLFSPGEGAEALALAVWPQLLGFLIVILMGFAGLRAGGRTAMHIAAFMTVLYAYGMGRFMPGSADHHNLQLTFASLAVAMLLDPSRRASNFAMAGMAVAMEIAIGAEAVPFVAAVSVVVASLWAWHGPAMRRPAIAYGLSLVLVISFAFFLTVPPHLYGMVTCDNLSLGFYSLASMGGALLALSAAIVSGRGPALRFAALGLVGVAVLATAKIIAPQCLGNPLGDLDPMLVQLWLAKVIEAQSIVQQWQQYPTTAGGFYAAGFIALFVCLLRIVRGERREVHLILLPLIGISVAVAAIQVRGAMFSNLLAIPPAALLVSDLRAWQQKKPDSAVRSLAYILTGLLLLPFTWAIAGLAVDTGWNGLAKQAVAPRMQQTACNSRQALQPLAALPPGTVLAPSDLGSPLLRFTPHRVLSAPYHRNQAGMLTELNTGLAMPAEAIAFLRGAKVDYVVFCPGEIQTKDLARLKPDGFYGSLMAGRVPAYLEPLNHPGKGDPEIFRVLR